MKRASLGPMLVIATLGLTGAVTLQAQDNPHPGAPPNATHASSHAMANPATKAPDTIYHGPLAKGRNSFTQAQARERLEKAGFSHVGALTKDADGLWQARAMRDGRWVQAALDYKGNVGAL